MEITMKIGTDETAIRSKCVNEWCCHLLSSYCIADRLDMERWWNGASGNKSSTQRKTSLEPLGTLRIQNRLFVDLHRFFEATDERLTGRAVAEIWRMREQLKVWMGLRLRSIETSFEETLKKQNRNIVRNVGRKGRDSNYFKLFFLWRIQQTDRKWMGMSILWSDKSRFESSRRDIPLKNNGKGESSFQHVLSNFYPLVRTKVKIFSKPHFQYGWKYSFQSFKRGS